MNRFKQLFPIILAASFAWCAVGGRPNVVLIMTDDQGFGEFSVHGNPITRTPHIERLALEGISLTDFHVAPMCTPTRGQLMTGLDAFRNGASNVSSGRALLRPELKTMADVFKAGGFRTGIFGKWHLGDNYPFRPEDRGFEEAIWFPSSHINSVPDFWENDYFDDTYFHNGKREKFKGYCTDIFFDEAIGWMEKQRKGGKPFFAYIPLNSAHWPWFVPDEYRQPIRDAMEANPDVVKHLNPAIPQREGAGVLWKDWRFLENRMLFNVKDDLHQDHDVAARHPEVVARMRAHLNAWWDEVKDDVMEPQRVIIGSLRENPATLSACEWLDVFVDQQIQIRRGAKKNGVWHITVAKAGEYTLKMRRFPKESGKSLSETVPAIKVTDGDYPGGPGFDIRKARLRIGSQDQEKTVAATDEAITFKATLLKGHTTLQTWFIGPDNEELFGANFVTVERLN